MRDGASSRTTAQQGTVRPPHAGAVPGRKRPACPVSARPGYGIVSAFRFSAKNVVLSRQIPSQSFPSRQEKCMAAPADVLKTIKDKEVKFVDLRFTDTRGKEQHVQVPAKVFTQDKFDNGHAFDGSSIAGWKGIEDSDMVLMPDPDSARIDPFTDETTLNITCDVVQPPDGKGYDRDPRSLAKRAEAYLKSTGLGDTAYFGPEPEFFIFDAVEWSVDMSGSYCKVF